MFRPARARDRSRPPGLGSKTAPETTSDAGADIVAPPPTSDQVKPTLKTYLSRGTSVRPLLGAGCLADVEPRKGRVQPCPVRGVRHSPPAATTRRGHCNTTRDAPRPRAALIAAIPGVVYRPRRQERQASRPAWHSDVAPTTPTGPPASRRPSPRHASHVARSGGNRPPSQTPTPRRVIGPRKRPHRHRARDSCPPSDGGATPLTAL